MAFFTVLVGLNLLLITLVAAKQERIKQELIKNNDKQPLIRQIEAYSNKVDQLNLRNKELYEDNCRLKVIARAAREESRALKEDTSNEMVQGIMEELKGIKTQVRNSNIVKDQIIANTDHIREGIYNDKESK